ncbi:MAG TPA: 6-carboxytetrahydropterin synthase QueD [Phycisphaerae bacterium]|nr:6-carboxytetrahydropterin synthase QueD [Phycisphaerae bacterium]HNU44991.1 6-carboxytetrahydropterin synthase QueD [Phycisphaerae bacterium]
MTDGSQLRHVRLARSFSFEAAHHLPRTPDGHRCRRLHGHSYRVDITCAGPVDPQTGWLIDFGDIRAAFEPLRARLDHTCLNDVEGLENPTAENLARWIWERLKPVLPLLTQVRVAEGCHAYCEYEGA